MHTAQKGPVNLHYPCLLTYASLLFARNYVILFTCLCIFLFIFVYVYAFLIYVYACLNGHQYGESVRQSFP